MSSRPIAILGCGPSALLAAHAVSLTEHPLAIFSNLKASKIGGAQYLHRSIPGLTDLEPDGMLMYRVSGDRFNYQLKAYPKGTNPPFVSFEHVHDGMIIPAWSLRDAYERLWRAYSPHINDMTVTPAWIHEHLREFTMIVSTIPRNALCEHLEDQNEQPPFHYFKRQQIQILNKCIVANPEPDNVIYYDGSKDRSWYRASMIFGTGSTEWGEGIKLPHPQSEIRGVFKPVSTNCDCFWEETNLIHVGRYGRWLKGVLTHHAYEDTLRHLQARGLITGKVFDEMHGVQQRSEAGRRR